MESKKTQHAELHFDVDFEHFISLGYCCYLAKDLEAMGLRDASMPLDWTITSWSAVEKSFNDKFEGFLNYDSMYQFKSSPSIYKNPDYGVDFYHDFNKTAPLASQIESVQKKYDRRIERFFECIQSPTLFFRYCADKEELLYIKNNYDSVISMIKSYNPLNEIVFISHDHLEDAELFPIEHCCFIEKDPVLGYNEHPINQISELCDYLSNVNYPKRSKNLEFFQNKQSNNTQKNKKTAKTTIQKTFPKLTHLISSRKNYRHNKQCD